MRLINANKPRPTGDHWEDSVTIERVLATGKDKILDFEGRSVDVSLHHLILTAVYTDSMYWYGDETFTYTIPSTTDSSCDLESEPDEESAI